MVDRIDRLFEEQLANWPLLARGIEGLKLAETRAFEVNGYTIRVRHLPHRIASTTAAVDRASVIRRPCFLCAANLPPEEKGIEFNSEFTVYCNPFPILDRHLTIVHKEHRPQRITRQVSNMAALAAALPGYFLIYNGPECGASAPDHMHFQACSARGVPLVEDVKRSRGMMIPNYGRHALVLRGDRRDALVARLESAIERWNQIAGREPEPMLNLAMFGEAGEIVAVLFPRGKHRPAVFHSGEMTVSPATIDLSGVVVTPVEKDYRQISDEDIRRIFGEVSVSQDIFDDLVESVQNVPGPK